MPTVGSLARDVRALGASAPLRAAYEASKRSGFHSILFREMRDRGYVSVPVGLGGVIPVSDFARKRCLEDARAILEEGTRVFGRRVPTGVHAAWNLDPLTGNPWPLHEKWWRIDIRSGERLSDVKWVWEAARHRDLVILARAAALESEADWLSELEAMLKGWLEQCPPERGVNWYSSLELALRAIAWAQVLELVGERLDPEVRSGLDAHLIASARHIMLELPYTVSSMKNNHLLGDGLGLVVIGQMFPRHPGASRWQRIGDALFLKQLARHMHPDGSMIEDSLSYHRFVLEMMVIRVLLGGASEEVRVALVGATQHLECLGVFDGEVPQYGDWDEGRVLADSQPAGSVAGSAWAALALSGREVPDEVFDDHDEVAWYVGRRRPGTGNGVRELARLRRSGDFHVIGDGDLRVWVKSGTSPSHQHADITAVWIQRAGEWIVQDPGTGTYNGPLEVRNGFRTSAAHPVWRPDGADQLVPHRAFRWLRSPGVQSAEYTDSQECLVLVVHDSFVTEPERARVARLVSVREGQVAVVDFVERTGERPWRMTLPLGAAGQQADLVGATGDVRRGQEQPFRGWTSPTYGAWAPSRWLELTLDGCVHAWGLGIPTPTLVPGGARIGETGYFVDWSDHGAAVSIRRAGQGPIVLRAVRG
jgi:hypothetical protein